MINCGHCGTANPADHSFCSNCGSPLVVVCPNCETANEPANNFCFKCGSALAGDAGGGTEPEPIDPISDSGERRLVSVLFADLVGFTTFSEGSDPEDVRNMLTHFYEKCREIIGRYGGTTDKFIGDAVMGVWGAKGANEDDAERATRAALELVDMVGGLGTELAIPDLAARAGVLSGEASVGSGGNDQGLVVGDLVNTASRLQSIADPGTVFVGSSTRDLVGNAVEFREAGEQRVKGKDLPVTAFEAVRVLALSTARAGSDLLEGPFVGRDDELRLLKDQLHATGRESRARMVSVIGEGGIGKSRLAQELIRYIDGITEVVYYHRGRSPSYGDGVSFWALGEMIKQRAGISEGEDLAKARMKLRTIAADFAPTEDDQRWIEPRLAAVVGLAESPPGDRSEHFAALRAFFQSIANRGTVLMVFEDLHWADDGLLDFIEELVERTTSHPILILCLARPELLERRPDWAASRKRTLSMHLGRLDEESMIRLVIGLAPGLAEQMVLRIAQRTAGVPLHAVEFVRMLFNTGQLVRDGDTVRFTGTDDQMPIPDSVSAIIGARLDRLDPKSQPILRDASVLGLTFTLSALARLRDESEAEIESALSDLVRREVLEFDENPRSPERGQYRFVQGLIREVAYGRLSRPERVSLNLAIAEMFAESDDPELAGVIASHYADAVEADPGNQDLAKKACQAVIEAAERASSLKSDTQAAVLYERAAEMTTDERESNYLILSAADCLARTGREDKGAALARDVRKWCRENDDLDGEIQAVTTLANILSANFEAAESADLTSEIYGRVEPSSDPTWTRLAQETSRALFLAGRSEEAIEVANAALPILEDLELVPDLINTLISKGTALMMAGKWIEGSGLLNGASVLAGDRDLHGLQLRAVNNLAAATQYDNNANIEAGDLVDAIASRVGDEGWLVRGHFFAAWNLVAHGRIEEALERIRAGEDYDLSELWSDNFETARLRAEIMRDGADDERLGRIHELWDKYLDTEDPQSRVAVRSAKGFMLLSEGHLREALALGLSVEDLASSFPSASEVAVFAAAELGDREIVEEVLAVLDDRHSRGRASRGMARVAKAYSLALDGDPGAAEVAFSEGEDLWEKTVSPEELSYARALFALVAGEGAFAASKAEQAREWFTDHDLKLHLDGVMSRVPSVAESPDVAV